MDQRDLSLIYLLIKSVCPSIALEVLCDRVQVDNDRRSFMRVQLYEGLRV